MSMKDSLSDWSRLVELMARLRSEDGCPWDRRQTHQSLRPFLIEEAYEVLDAIDSGDPQRLREELGDLLLQVVFHAQIGSEEGEFDLSEVIRTLVNKLVARHPHVFDQKEDLRPDEVQVRWGAIKTSKGEGRFDGLPTRLPALLRAQRVSDRAAGVGFDWPGALPVIEKIREELGEVVEAMDQGDRRLFEEVGDLLFATVNLARHLGVQAEDALRAATRRFEGRFALVEQLALEQGLILTRCTDQKLDELWERAKERLSQGD
ncbi:MAG: nucleoside triphosphate pyrophosphohydrolase [Bradymonadales bacterium]|nr:nucleoside triphosphate pyrophosphohydrolase [Bradymonadales bacterium]